MTKTLRRRARSGGLSIFGLGVAALLTASNALGQDEYLDWRQAFKRAQNETDCRQKIHFLRLSIDDKPEPAFRARGLRTQKIRGYFPYVALAEAHLECGETGAAQEALLEAKRKGGKIVRKFEKSATGAESSRKALERKLGLERRERILAAWRQINRMEKLARATSAGGSETMALPTEAERARAEELERHSPRTESASPLPSEEPEEIAALSPRRPPKRSPLENSAMDRDEGPQRESTRSEAAEPQPQERAGANPTLPLESSSDPEAPRSVTTTEPRVEPPNPPPTPPGNEEEDTVRLTVGDELSISCRSCLYHPSEGILVIGEYSVRLPRGYQKISFRGRSMDFPKDRTTSYDSDLDAFQLLVELWRDSRLTLALPPPESKPPTPWLAGVMLFWPQGRPPHLYGHLKARFEELVALKTIRYRKEITKQLHYVAPPRSR